MVVVSPSSMEAAWRFYQFIKPEAETITGKVEITEDRLDALKAKLVTIDAVHKEIAALPLENVSPVALIEIILAGAMGLRASDIHTEAEEKKAKIRFRIDGLLHDMFDDIPLGAYHTFVSRIKLLSEMKLNVATPRRTAGSRSGLARKISRCACP